MFGRRLNIMNKKDLKNMVSHFKIIKKRKKKYGRLVHLICGEITNKNGVKISNKKKQVHKSGLDIYL